MKLNRAATVAALTLPPGKNEAIFFDDDVPGFGVRLRESGARVWIVQYRIGSKNRRITLGSTKLLDPANARNTARDILADVRRGDDPAGKKLEARSKAHETFGVIAARFLARQKAKLRPRSYAETQRYLNVTWKSLHGLALGRVTQATVASRLGLIADTSGPTTADRARAALSAFFTWAMHEGIAPSNPVAATNKHGNGKSRDRTLSDAELAVVWKASPGDQYGAIVRLLLLTGQRREEIGALRWSEINRDKALIAFPGERTKNGRPHDVPLADMALAIIEAQPQREDRNLIFGEREGAFQGWSKAKAALDKAIAKNGAVAPWRLHDLRRTVATRMCDLGVQPHVVEAVLNHVSGHKSGVAGIYNRSVYTPEKRAALILWADHVSGLAGGKAANIIMFPAQGGK